MKSKIRVLAAVIVLLVSIAHSSESRAEIWVFGDSLSDTGNVYDYLPLVFDPSLPFSRLPTPPFVGGQASNGPVWVQQLASRLGVAPLTPSRTGGTNYAHIAALTREVTGVASSPIGSPSLDEQVAAYLTTNSPTPTDLFVVWGGANDFFYGQTDPFLPVLALSEQITSLAAAGARRFVVPNLPLLGQTPSGAASGDDAALNLLSRNFNDWLDLTLDGLRGDLGVTIHEVDVEQYFLDVMADPGAFGFTNVDTPAVTTILDPDDLLFGFPTFPAEVVPNPDEYLFWDGVHPTSVAHRFLGDLAADAVIPEPSTLALWSLTILIGLGYGWRKRRGSDCRT